MFHSNTYKRDYCNLIIVKATHSSYHYYIFTMERQRSIVLKKDIVMYQKKTWQFNYFFMANVPKKLMILIIMLFSSIEEMKYSLQAHFIYKTIIIGFRRCIFIFMCVLASISLILQYLPHYHASNITTSPHRTW